MDESQKKILWLRRRLDDPEIMDTLKDIVIEGFDYTNPCDYETYPGYELEIVNSSTIAFINSYIELYGEEHFDPTSLENFVSKLIISKYHDLILSAYQNRYCDEEEDDDESDY
jgi:hypothetical protein